MTPADAPRFRHGQGPALALLLAAPEHFAQHARIHSYLGLRKTVAYVCLVVLMATVTGWFYRAFFE